MIENPFWWWWLGSGVIAGLIIVTYFKKFNEEEGEETPEGLETFIGVVCGLLGFISVALVIGGAIFFAWAKWKDDQDMEAYEQEQKVKAVARAEATKKRKDKILKNHVNDIEKLEELKNKYESNPEKLNEKFFKDAGKLSSDLLMIPKKEVQKKETAISIIRFARVNIFNCFPESKEKESERIANKLTKALKKL